MRVVGRADDDRSADGLAVDLEEDEGVLRPSNADAFEGRVQTCLRSIAMLTVTYQPGWRWSSELGMSISVWSVRVDGSSENAERTTLPSRVAPEIACRRIVAVSPGWM